MDFIEELRKQFPLVSFEELFHVGTLNKEDKQTYCLEGEGLSVSICPDEWREITSLQGDLYSFTKQNNRFLDFHNLNEEQKDMIIAWGLINNYIEPCKIYQVTFYHGDFDMEMVSSSLNYEEALEEADGNEEEVRIVDGFKATKKMNEKTLQDDISPALTLDLLSTIYAEKVLNIDGVYWDDELDTSILSAPRGVISLSQLDSWTFLKVAEL